MREVLTIAGLIAGILVAMVVAWIIGAKRAAMAMIRGGSPTPDDARVKTEAIDADTHRQMEKDKNAPMAQKIDRARALRERGRLRGDE